MNEYKPCYYWDACVFIAWITDEQKRSPIERDGLREIARQIHSNEARLITSIITITEVLQSYLTEEQSSIYEKFLRRRNCSQYPFDKKIADIGREIRDYYHNLNDRLPTIAQADTVHLATAIYYEVKEFHTFDEKNIFGGKRKRKKRGLIPLSGNVAGKYGLKICKPPPPKQLTLL